MRLRITSIDDNTEKITIGYSYFRNNFQVALTLLFSISFTVIGVILALLIKSPLALYVSYVFIGLGLIIFFVLLIYLRLTKTTLLLNTNEKTLTYKNQVLPVTPNATLLIKRTFKISRTLLGIIPFVPEYDAYWELFYINENTKTRILFFKQQLIDRIRDLPELDHLVRYISANLGLPVIDETGIEHLILKPKDLGKSFIEHLETCYTKNMDSIHPKNAIINKRREKERSIIYSINHMPQPKNLVYPALPILLLEVFGFVPLFAVLMHGEPSDVIKLVFMAWFFPIVVISWLLYFYLIKDAYSEDLFIITPKSIELAYKNLFYIRIITRIPLKKLQLIILPQLNNTYMIELISANHRVHGKGRYTHINDILSLKKTICDEIKYLLTREKQGM